MNLLADISSLRIAPTFGRELTAQLVAVSLVSVVAFLFVESAAIQIAIIAAYLFYMAVRLVLAAKQGATG